MKYLLDISLLIREHGNLHACLTSLNVISSFLLLSSSYKFYYHNYSLSLQNVAIERMHVIFVFCILYCLILALNKL